MTGILNAVRRTRATTTRLATPRKLEVEHLEDRVVLTANTYINALFHQYLNRDPGSAGQTYWQGALNTGTTPQQVAAQVIQSSEGEGDAVNNMYDAMLGHGPGTSGTWAWLDLQNGASIKDVEAQVANSDEFFNRAGGNDASWLQAVYQTFLGRPLDGAGQGYWGSVLGSGASRLDVADALASTPEALTASVVDAYGKILGYNPSSDGAQFWTQQQQDGMSPEDMEAQVAGSTAGIQQADKSGLFNGFSPLDPFAGSVSIPAALGQQGSSSLSGQFAGDFFNMPLTQRVNTANSLAGLFSDSGLGATQMAADIFGNAGNWATPASGNLWSQLADLRLSDPSVFGQLYDTAANDFVDLRGGLPAAPLSFDPSSGWDLQGGVPTAPTSFNPSSGWDLLGGVPTAPTSFNPSSGLDLQGGVPTAPTSFDPSSGWDLQGGVPTAPTSFDPSSGWDLQGGVPTAPTSFDPSSGWDLLGGVPTAPTSFDPFGNNDFSGSSDSSNSWDSSSSDSSWSDSSSSEDW